MQNDNTNERLFSTEFAEEANAMELVGSYDSEREVWVGADGALATGPTTSTTKAINAACSLIRGTDTDY